MGRHRIVFAAGAFSLAAQTLLFRELLVAFHGSELATGAFFGTWLCWVTVGAWLGRHLPPRGRRPEWALLAYVSALAAQVDDALRATLRWDGTGDTDLGVYVVYRDGAEVGRTPAVRRLFRDADVAAGRSYTYAVAAVDTLGNEGPRSEPLAVLVGDPDPPRRVYNVRAERAAGGVALVWPAVPDADVAGYRVEGAIAPTGVFRAVGGLREGTAATVPTSAGPWFRVVAVDTSGNESGPSEAVRAE